jgi:hypothetical protein
MKEAAMVVLNPPVMVRFLPRLLTPFPRSIGPAAAVHCDGPRNSTGALIVCKLTLLLVMPGRSMLSVKPVTENAPAEGSNVSELMLQGESANGPASCTFPAMMMLAEPSCVGATLSTQLSPVLHLLSEPPPSQTKGADSAIAHCPNTTSMQINNALDMKLPAGGVLPVARQIWFSATAGEDAEADEQQ